MRSTAPSFTTLSFMSVVKAFRGFVHAVVIRMTCRRRFAHFAELRYQHVIVPIRISIAMQLRTMSIARAIAQAAETMPRRIFCLLFMLFTCPPPYYSAPLSALMSLQVNVRLLPPRKEAVINYRRDALGSSRSDFFGRIIYARHCYHAVGDRPRVIKVHGAAISRKHAVPSE